MNKITFLRLALLACAAVMLSADSASAVLCYPDGDDDGYGDAAAPGIDVPTCSPGFIDNNGDCDDTDASRHPGAPEVCNGTDDDCNGEIDDNTVGSNACYLDEDQDGFGTPDFVIDACPAPPGYVEDDTDCDDGDASVHPGAPEVCNGTDDDCNGATDDNTVDTKTWYLDEDQDGFGRADFAVDACPAPPGYVEDDTDCDDGDDAIHPGATELCDGVDQDCDGAVDDGCGGCPVALTGDVNVTGTLTSADIIAMVNYCFKGGAAPLPCAASSDVNCNGTFTSSDIIFMVNHVFKSGPAPCNVCTLIPATWSCP